MGLGVTRTNAGKLPSRYGIPDRRAVRARRGRDTPRMDDDSDQDVAMEEDSDDE